MDWVGYRATLVRPHSRVSCGLFQNCHDLEKMDLEECVLVSRLLAAS